MSANSVSIANVVKTQSVEYDSPRTYRKLKMPGDIDLKRSILSLLTFAILCWTVSTLLAAEFVLSLVDSSTHQPVAARVYVENVETGQRHFVRSLSATDAVIYQRQNWANKNSIEHHTSVPAAPLAVENLAAGTYVVTIERGKEYFPEMRRIVLKEGEQRPAETIELRRWVNMAELGWYSGETHLHRPLNELPVVLQAEDLNVAMPLTYWETRAFQPPTSGNKNQSGEIPDKLIAVDPTHVIWPRNTEYEIFTVNEHRHTLGALFILNHKSVLDIGVPEWKPVADRARAEGALMDMDKLDWPFGMTLPHLSGATLYELANNHLWRTEFGLTQWNSQAPAFMQPPFGGKQGNEFDWLNYTLGQYYTLLNAGFRLVPTAGTASGVHPVPAGFSRVYVPLEGSFNYEDWLSGLRDGRSFVTTGPMMFAKVNDLHPGAMLDGEKLADGKVRLSARILGEHPLKSLEVIRNGQIIPIDCSPPTQTPEGAWRTEVTIEVPLSTSGWLCLRCQEDRPDGRLRFAHSAPWHVVIPGHPLRLSEREKHYLIERVQQEISRSTGVLPESAIQEYRSALQHFESLHVAEESAAAQPTKGSQSEPNSNIQNVTQEFPAIAAEETGDKTGPIRLPDISRVDAQPLLLLTRRLVEALETNGAPLSAQTKFVLVQLNSEPDDARVTSEVQRVLDPLCAAAVEIAGDGTIRVVAGHDIEVEENGCRTVLVKVLNRAGVQSRLRVESPQSRPIPHGPLEDVPNRWLSLNAYDGRPMDATLSGLELEYRLLQVSSTQTGQRTARLEFNVEVAGSKDSHTIRQWKFNQDADGWGQLNNLLLEVRDRAMHLTATGSDPYMSATVQARGGRMVLRFWGKTDSSEIGQVFWWTEQLPQPDGQRQVNFQLNAGRNQEYAIEFPVEGDLRGVRIDPLQSEGTFRIEWISLEYAAGENGVWSGADVQVRTVPSTKVAFQVADADGSPCMGCFEIRDAQGRVYPAQPKRQAPDFFFQTQVYRESGESIRLPPGQYNVICSHGPESLPETKSITVGHEPMTIDYRVERWIDTAKLGYWSGDHHIHAAGCLHYENPTQGVHPPDMLRHIMGEDVKVGCCLTWGPCFDYQKQFFRGRPDDVSRYPYLLRYDIEVSGFGSHQSGHLNLLKLSQQIPEGGDSKTHWPTLGLNTLRWAKRQGAVTGTAHSGAGLERSVGRVPGEDGPHQLPSYDIPAFDGIGANEFIMQVTHQVPGVDGRLVPALDFIATMNTPREFEWNIWYHVLNCGIPVVASGETDFPCMTGERVGVGRVYVKLDGTLDYNDWAEALRRGESYVSNGTSHLLNFDRHPDGSFSLDAAAHLPDVPEVDVELIANGLPVAIQKLRADGELRKLTFAAPEFHRSTWVAARIFPSSHTNPIWIQVDGKPVCEKASVVWCLAALEQCWKSKQRTYAESEMKQAKSDYEHARQTYQKLLEQKDEP